MKLLDIQNWSKNEFFEIMSFWVVKLSEEAKKMFWNMTEIWFSEKSMELKIG